MSSDKAPDKVVYVKGNFSNENYFCGDPYHHSGETVLATYIREDLTLDAKLQRPGSFIEYETEKQLGEMRKTVGGNIANMQRRREMFEKVALAFITLGSTPDYDFIGGFVSKLIKEADKFARGEE